MKNLIGKQFGYLKVLDLYDEIAIQQVIKKRRWLCVCSCGKRTVVLENNLKSGNTKSCGCQKGKRKLR